MDTLSSSTWVHLACSTQHMCSPFGVCLSLRHYRGGVLGTNLEHGDAHFPGRFHRLFGFDVRGELAPEGKVDKKAGHD